MALPFILLVIAATLFSSINAQSCATNTTCPSPFVNGLLMLKPTCSGPNTTIQQFGAGECINTTAFDNTTAIDNVTAIDIFKMTFINGADFYVPELTLYPAADCNASASTAKTWTLKFNNRDKYGRKTTACHRFSLDGRVPGSVRFAVRALARPHR